MVKLQLILSGVLSLFAVSFSLDTLIFATREDMGNPADTKRFEELFFSMVAPKLFDYAVVVIDSSRWSNGDVCYPSQSRSVIRCSLYRTSVGSKLRFVVSYGSEAYSINREIAWDGAENNEQNMAIFTAKIIRFFEETLLARVQLQSDPAYAQVEIDGKIKASTPFETFLPLGRHLFLLKLTGYDSLLANEVVTSGNNRFSFLLKPVTVRQEPQQIKVFIKEKQVTVLPWLIASVVSASVALFASVNYSDTDTDYDNLVSNDVSAYDRLNKEANRWLLIRNVTGTVSILTTIYSVYGLFNNRQR